MTIVGAPEWPPDNFSWYLDDGRGDPDLVEVVELNHRLVNLHEGVPTTIGFNVLLNDEFHVRFVTPQNQPNASFWGSGLDPAFNVRGRFRVVTSNSNVRFRIDVARVGFDGQFKQAYANSAFESPTFPPAKKNWNTSPIRDQSVPQGTRPYFPILASDRIRVDLVFLNTTSGSRFIEIELGTVDAYVEVPIAMGLSRIIYDTTTLSLPGGISQWAYQRRPDRSLVISQGGVTTTSVRHKFDHLMVKWEQLADAAFEEAVRAFWAWASEGNPFSFARDVTDAQETTLVFAGAPAGQKNIDVSDETGFVQGNTYLLRQNSGNREEMFTVQNAPIANRLVATQPLKFGYVPGDLCRSRHYFPKLVLDTSVDPVVEGLTTYDFGFSAREDRS